MKSKWLVLQLLCLPNLNRNWGHIKCTQFRIGCNALWADVIGGNSHSLDCSTGELSVVRAMHGDCETFYLRNCCVGSHFPTRWHCCQLHNIILMQDERANQPGETANLNFMLHTNWYSTCRNMKGLPLLKTCILISYTAIHLYTQRLYLYHV